MDMVADTKVKMEGTPPAPQGPASVGGEENWAPQQEAARETKAVGAPETVAEAAAAETTHANPPPGSAGFDKVMLSLLSLNEANSSLQEIFPDFDGLEPLDIMWPDEPYGGNNNNNNGTSSRSSSNGSNETSAHHLSEESEDDFDSDFATPNSSFSPSPSVSAAVPPPPPPGLAPHQQQRMAPVANVSSCCRCCCGAASNAPYVKVEDASANRPLPHNTRPRHMQQHQQHQQQHHQPSHQHGQGNHHHTPPPPPSANYQDDLPIEDGGDFFADSTHGGPSATATPAAAVHVGADADAHAFNEDFSLDESTAADHQNVIDPTMMLEKEILYGSFDEHLFVDRYQRNNKCSGLKNLRCFPNCGPTHQPRKFCGQGITFHASYKPSACELQPQAGTGAPQFVAFGRFDTALGLYKDVEIGSLASLEAIQAKERKRGRPLAPWYPSCQETAPSAENDSVLIDFKFNSKEHQGWHYDWVATKYTCDTLHVFNVYIFVVESGDNIRCVGKFSSPAFQLYCRRRQRFRRMGTSTPNTSPATLLYHIATLLQKAQDPSALADSDLDTPASPGSVTDSLPGSATNGDAAASAAEDAADNKGAGAQAAEKQRRLQRILRRLARHVLGESAFTEHITNVCEDIAYRRDRGESIDVGYGRFLDAVRQYLHNFFKENGSTLTEIEELQTTAAEIAKSNAEAAIRSENGVVAEDKSMDQRKYGTAPLKDSKNPERRVRQVFLDLVDSCSTDANRLKRPRRVEPHVLEGLEGLSKRLRIEVYSPSDAATVMGSPRDNLIDHAVRLPKSDIERYTQYDPSEPWIGLDPNGEPDLNGPWSPETFCAMRLTHLRMSTIKMPWMRTKMLDAMEKESFFEQTPTTLRIRLQRKLLSDGLIDYVFDGKEHPFDLRDPLMGVSTPMALTKQAFVYGNAIVIRHRYTETSRYTRIWWRNDQGSAYGRGILETRASNESPWTIHNILVANLVAHQGTLSPLQQHQQLGHANDLDLPPSPALLRL
ncbi:Hypothetical Protein FCC1311_095822 [Hondaea fermentalgiana]|uniref:Uncharacterized protein n=1 Tax=Hondaea fermentalgiana TaxID=2315210 RepID=A0A2R5GSS3_9STRA|nr:Hypothetical Protein FCC1311_095822 [Hondaea fermentalgiana]|eukprot:GBG33359.1 Hypothetical Protein FCC1311_095822 [Hondaea fermentalgiana]